MVNPAMIFKMKAMWDEFTGNHPKFPKFLQAAVSQPLEEDTIIEINIKRPNGDLLASNVKLTASDLALIDQLKNLGNGGMQ